MSTVTWANIELRDLYTEESARIRREFVSSGDGIVAVAQRAALLDQVLLRLWERHLSPGAGGEADFALVATGGYGRKRLFPFSDVDLLFLHADRSVEARLQDRIRAFSQDLWDLGIKLSPASRVLAECDRFDPKNVEFTIALLDCRFLAGDQELFARLHDKTIPKLVMRESQLLVQRLAELTRARHGKHGNTVFHLEPNVKDSPGGLRDHNLAHWLALIAAIDKLHDWSAGNDLLPPSMRKPVEAAHDFLMAVRCFLHFRHGRDDNSLSWTDQDAAAAQKIGAADAEVRNPAEWMRLYFRQARS